MSARQSECEYFVCIESLDLSDSEREGKKRDEKTVVNLLCSCGNLNKITWESAARGERRGDK